MNFPALRWFVAAAIATAAIFAVLLIAACSSLPANPYNIPAAQPGIVIWRMVPADQVAAVCHNPSETREIGCWNGLEIITRPPQNGDYSLIQTLQYEVAHAQGWRRDPLGKPFVLGGDPSDGKRP